jgi:hypothetical protein
VEATRQYASPIPAQRSARYGHHREQDAAMPQNKLSYHEQCDNEYDGQPSQVDFIFAPAELSVLASLRFRRGLA